MYMVHFGPQKLEVSVNLLDKGMFLYSMVSSPWDCSKGFTLHPPADLFIPMLFQLLLEAFSHAAITAQTSFRYPSLSVATSQVLTYTAE